MHLSTFLRSPVRIGDAWISSRLAAAPMLGLSHSVLRQVMLGYGGVGLLWTEMCAAREIPRENPATSEVFRWAEQELPFLVCQLVGDKEEELIPAARRIQEEGFFGLDLNMGCSAPAVCKRGAGAALLKRPRHACALVHALRRAVRIPVLVKFRTGWENNLQAAVDLAKGFADAGADALTFHPRIAPDRRTRPAHWEHITAVQRAVHIPVFGNGDVFTPEDARRMVEQTGCAGISLGRIAVARPWIFAHMTGKWDRDPDIYRQTALQVLEGVWAGYPPNRARKLYARFMTFFCANFTFGARLRAKLLAGQSLEELREAAHTHLPPCPQTIERPNAHLFTA